MSMITVAEAAENWGISVQLVRRYCREKRIPEAVMYDGIWFIPDDAPRPDREESEPAAMPPLLRRLHRQRSSGYADLYNYLQINMSYSSNRMSSNRLTRNHVEYLFKKGKILATNENMKLNDFIEVRNHFPHHFSLYSFRSQTLLRPHKAQFGFPRKKLKDIKPIDVETMLKDLRREGRSISCLTQCRGMMFQIMNKAEANDLIRKNPVRFAEKMRYREPVKRKDAFTAEEVSILMERLPEDRIGLSIRLMLGTGMRSQELLALEPRHIEPDGSVIHIEQAINMQKGTATIGIPKSRDSYRNIPVPKSLQYCAMTLRETDRKYIWEARKVNQPCNPTYFRDQFRKALEAIPEVRLLTPHSCRHTYVSQMQALGVDLSTIQSIVGHADVSMTQHYLHVQESIRMDAVDRFSKAFPTGRSDPDGPDEPSCKVLKFPNVG